MRQVRDGHIQPIGQTNLAGNLLHPFILCFRSDRSFQKAESLLSYAQRGQKKILFDFEIKEQLGGLIGSSQSQNRALADGIRCDLLIEQMNNAGISWDDSCDEVEEGCFPCPVWANQGPPFSNFHVQVDVTDSLNAAKRF